MTTEVCEDGTGLMIPCTRGTGTTACMRRGADDDQVRASKGPRPQNGTPPTEAAVSLS
jgi:hypothetical protein